MPSVPGPTPSARGSCSPLLDEDTNSDPALQVELALNFLLPVEEFEDLAMQLDDLDGAHNDIDSASEPVIPPSPITSSSSSDSFALLDFFSESEKSVSDDMMEPGGQDSDQVPGQEPLKREFHPILNGTSELSKLQIDAIIYIRYYL